MEENPSWATCLRGRDHLLRQGAELIIALGGGSVLDAAKAMALAATNTGSLAGMIERRDYLQKPLPTMAIPTTAGTGSEVTQYCIITDEATHDKLNLHTPHSFPWTAILDPVCTLSMPRTITIGTGMDALSHAVEGYLSRRASSESDRLA
ncbi:MAG: iron-containing alcohol dehydrogenase, partial [Deltaproteobacteria bacterium]|nr:iron-containing alcohol dehydrogenase [Deltaproteobacteria bacterium]